MLFAYRIYKTGNLKLEVIIIRTFFSYLLITFVGIHILTRHVLTGQIPPETTIPGDGQQLCEVSSPSKVSVIGNIVRKKSPCVNCDLDLGDMTMSQGHDTIV